jgi:hypothetical protein
MMTIQYYENNLHRLGDNDRKFDDKFSTKLLMRSLSYLGESNRSGMFTVHLQCRGEDFMERYLYPP